MFKFLSRLGDSNEREVRALEPIVERINALEPELQAFSDDEPGRRPMSFAAGCANGSATSSSRSSCVRPTWTRMPASRRWPAPMPRASPTS